MTYSRGSGTLASSLTAPDPSWESLYKIGGIAAFLYVLLGLIAPAAMSAQASYDFHMDAPRLLAFIADHSTWFMIFQSLVLASSVAAMITFAALYAALQQIDKGVAAVGALLAISLQLLFMAYYPVLLGMVQLAGQFPAADAARREVLSAAMEALLAQNNAFNPLYESVFALGVSLLSIVMLKGPFPRWMAYLGMAHFPAAVIALSLWPVVNIGYFWWWILFVVWFPAVGWKLLQFGRKGFRGSGL